MKVNFISNLPLSEISGGFSGMNHAAHGALHSLAEINYVGPINPPVNLLCKAYSKGMRVLGGKGVFPFFSESRLGAIARDVESKAAIDVDLDFYHGFTPWIGVNSGRPYIAWNDCSFLDYMKIFQDSSKFTTRDLDRIYRQESEWLGNAEAVILSSEWAKKRIIKDYKLDPAKVHSVGIFGALTPPDNDTGPHGCDFLFISTDYKKKNGRLCREAIEILWPSYPDARLRIIGDAAPESDLVPGKVTYEGFFRKSEPSELEAFRNLLADAYAVVHPTDADTTAMILIEAAFFGCPAISVYDFAIPEVMKANSLSTLLNRPITPEGMATAMKTLLKEKDSYIDLRNAVRAQALKVNTRDQFATRMRNAILNVMP